MPKVFLTDESRAAEEERRQNEVFSLALRTARGRLGLYDKELQARTNTSKSFVSNLKRPEHVSLARFGAIRALAHEIRLSADDWLRLGGYKGKGEK